MTGDDAAAALGDVLSATEAKRVADSLARGSSLSRAVAGVDPRHRAAVERLCQQVVSAGEVQGLRLLLRSLATSLARESAVVPLWTIPGNLHASGAVTTQIADHVRGARASVVCSTFNLQRSSALLNALREIEPGGGIAVHVFVDTAATDGRSPSRGGRRRTPALSPKQLAAELPGAHVWQTRFSQGRFIRNHAKFVSIDHQKLVVTSANMSRSAERYNVELGLVVVDRLLTQQVERSLFGFRDQVYRRASV